MVTAILWQLTLVMSQHTLIPQDIHNIYTICFRETQIKEKNTDPTSLKARSKGEDITG